MSANFARRSARNLVALLALGGTLSAAAPNEGLGLAATRVADVGITVKVDEGPYVVGQVVSIEITVTNHGPVTATNVNAYNLLLSGTYHDTNMYGPMSGSSGASIPSGEKLVVTIEALLENWPGPPVARFSVSSARDSSSLNNTVDVTFPMIEPDSGRGSVSGLLYGDANDNGAADVGEGLPGIHVSLSGPSLLPKVRTDSDGRFRFDDLPLRNYEVHAYEEPAGWVLPTYPIVNVNVDGDGDAQVEYRAVRPVSDRLEASMAFTQDSYEVGQTAQVAVVLTNKGTTDISGIKAACGSEGEGQRIVEMRLGDMAWGAAGVTVAAGQSRTFTLTGVVPAHAAGFASISALCDFGPGDISIGFPESYSVARVPGAGPGGTRGVLYRNRDDDQAPDADELLAGVRVDAIDAITGRLAATTTTDSEGRLEFTDLPAGPYTLGFHGPWEFQHGATGFFVGTCGMRCGGWSTSIVPGPDVPDTDPPGECDR